MKSKNLPENPVQDKLVTKVPKAELKQRAHAEASHSKKMDKVKFTLAIIVVLASLVGYYTLTSVLPNYILAAIPVVGVVIALGIVFFWCSLGKNLLAYIRESTVELKKVVWPERNDAIKTTIYVVLFVAVLAMVIWLADSLISWLFFDVLLKRG